MSQIVLHRKDTEDVKDKLATNSLSFKSINGNELKDFNDINGQYYSLIAQFNNIVSLQQRLLNVISNYRQAVTLMDGLYAQLYLVGRNNSSGSLTNNYNNIIARINSEYPVRFPKLSKAQLEDNT